MSEIERDEITAERTTGHEWNGIRELDTPVPRGILLFVIVTHLFVIVWWFLMPTFPLGATYSPGLLGIDQKQSADRAVALIEASREERRDALLARPEAQILADPRLVAEISALGHQLFGDNCAACHGPDARGNKGYPDLTDAAWPWGDGGAAAIAKTVSTGINDNHAQSRYAEMPAFGRDQILNQTEIGDVVRYVHSLSAPGAPDAKTRERIKAGSKVFANNCASCHGEEARGMVELGAPDLSDTVWLYGGSLQAIADSVNGGRAGHMPAWEARLSPDEIQTLALYLRILGAKER